MSTELALERFLLEFAVTASSDQYVCLRSPNLSNEAPFDIDIFTTNANQIIKRLEECAIKNSLNFSCNKKLAHKSHFDIIAKGKLILRFDLHYDFTFFKFLRPKTSFTDVLLSQSRVLECRFINKDIPFKVPEAMHEAILRYLEFHNFFPYKESKSKHLDWIHQGLSEQDMDIFYSRLHEICDFQQTLTFDPLEFISLKKKRTFWDEQYLLLDKMITYYKRYGFKRFLRRIFL